MFAPRNILVPTDFSKYSQKAFREAVDIGKAHGSKVYVLHVIDVIRQCTMEFCMDDTTENQLIKEGIKKAKEMFHKDVERLGDLKGLDIRLDVRKGVPYEEILKEQKARKIDLVVIASHGRTGLLRYLMGSVAERVTKGAKCSVLLVRK